MPDTINALLSLGVGYLIGSIPFGVITMRLAGMGDITKVGSGNIGATNVLRTGRKDLALLTLLGDGGKGALAVLAGWMIGRDGPDVATLMALAGGAAFFGHLFSVWLKFKGGKGVATFMGVMFATAWPAGLMVAGTWLIMAFLFRYSSLAALAAAVVVPIALYFMSTPQIAGLFTVMSLIVIAKHHANISRLLAGTEGKIGAKG